jgi:hypothetical protein
MAPNTPSSRRNSGGLPFVAPWLLAACACFPDVRRPTPQQNERQNLSGSGSERYTIRRPRSPLSDSSDAAIGECW